MVGKTLSHYTIQDELGRGGMGIVYKAEDSKLHRSVAIKVLPAAALANKDDRARFYREARAAASLSHPNIATVYEIDEAVPEGSKDDDLRPFIAMEFISGETLDEQVKRGPFKLKEAVLIASQVAQALDAAHEKNIVHRDIKTQNVMMTAKGDAKVLDFGLAQTAQSTKLTRLGSTLGTVAYMSPEQARGEEVDGRADLWSLGVVLYEMIAGRSPFPGDYEQAVLYEILNQDPEPLTALRTGVPMGLEWIVSKCLAKSPADRYQTATDLLVDLRNVDLSQNTSSHVSHDLSVRSSKPTIVKSRSTNSFPTRRQFYSLLGVALVAVTVAIWLFAQEPSIPIPAQGAPISFDALLPDSDSHGWLHLSPNGEYVAHMTRSGSEPELIIYNLKSKRERRVALDASHLGKADFSPDERKLLFVTNRLEFREIALETTELNSLVFEADLELAQGLVIHPLYLDTERIAFSAGKEIYVKQLNDNSEPELAVTMDSSLGYLYFDDIHHLPITDRLLATVYNLGDSNENAAIAWVDLSDGTMDIIETAASVPRYLQSGHLVYNKGVNTDLVAQPFDLATMSTYNVARTLEEGLAFSSWSIDQNGLFVKFSNTDGYWIVKSELRWLESENMAWKTIENSGKVIRISDDGKYIGWLATNLSTRLDEIQIFGSDGAELTTIVGDNPPVRFRLTNDAVAYTLLTEETNGKRDIIKNTLDRNTPPDTIYSLKSSLAAYGIHIRKDGSGLIAYDRDSEALMFINFQSDNDSLFTVGRALRPRFSRDDAYISWINLDSNRTLNVAETDRGDENVALADSVSQFQWGDNSTIVYSIRIGTKTELRKITLSMEAGISLTEETVLGSFDLFQDFDVDPIAGRVLVSTGVKGTPGLVLETNWFTKLEELAPTRKN